MPPVDVTPTERQSAINQLATTLLPLVKHDVVKANTYAVKVESNVYEMTTTRDAWLSKMHGKLKGVQQKVALQERTVAAAPAQASVSSQPVQQPPVLQAQQTQQQTFHSTRGHVAMPGQAHTNAVSAPSPYAQPQPMQQQQQPLAAHPYHNPQQNPPVQNPTLVSMPTFTDPAFQNLAQAFLEPDKATAHHKPTGMPAPGYTQQQQQHVQHPQQHPQQQQHQHLQQHQHMQQQHQQAYPNPQQQVLHHQGNYGQSMLVQQVPQQGQGPQEVQVAAARQVGLNQQQHFMVQQQQQQQYIVQQQQQRQPSPLPTATPAGETAWGQAHGMQPAVHQGHVGTTHMSTTPEHALQTQKAAAAASASAAVPAGLHKTQPYLAKYMTCQIYARQHMVAVLPWSLGKQRLVLNAMQDLKEMLRYLQHTPDTSSSRNPKWQHYAAMLALIEEKEPQLRKPIDASRVKDFHEKLQRLQKDVQKFRQYLVNSREKLAREAAAGAGPGGSQPSTNRSQGSVNPGASALPHSQPHMQGHALQEQQLSGGGPAAGLQAATTKVQQAPDVAHSPASGRGFLVELMDESQPTVAPTPPTAAGTLPGGQGAAGHAAILHAGSTSKPMQGDLKAASPGGLPASMSAAEAQGGAPRVARSPSGNTALHGAASMAASNGTASQLAAAAAVGPGLRSAGGSFASLPPGRDSAAMLQLPPADRLLVYLARREQAELDSAATGVKLLLRHAEVTIPTPPLLEEALRTDGWAREDVESLMQAPHTVLSRASASATVGGEPGQGRVRAGGVTPEEDLRPAKLYRVESAENQHAEAIEELQDGHSQEDGLGALSGRLVTDCQQVEASLQESGIRVALKPQRHTGRSVVIRCEWHGDTAAAPCSSILPPWKKLLLRVPSEYPSQAPNPVFCDKLLDLSTSHQMEAVQEGFYSALMHAPLPLTLGTVVRAWSQAVGDAADVTSE